MPLAKDRLRTLEIVAMDHKMGFLNPHSSTTSPIFSVEFLPNLDAHGVPALFLATLNQRLITICQLGDTLKMTECLMQSILGTGTQNQAYVLPSIWSFPVFCSYVTGPSEVCLWSQSWAARAHPPCVSNDPTSEPRRTLHAVPFDCANEHAAFGRGGIKEFVHMGMPCRSV